MAHFVANRCHTPIAVTEAQRYPLFRKKPPKISPQFEFCKSLISLNLSTPIRNDVTIRPVERRMVAKIHGDTVFFAPVSPRECTEVGVMASCINP